MAQSVAAPRKIPFDTYFMYGSATTAGRNPTTSCAQ